MQSCDRTSIADVRESAVHRVIQYGTGHTGLQALRGVLLNPQLQLVGLVVHSAAKVGRRACDIAGLPENVRGGTVRGTPDLDALLSLPADCVLYMPADPALSNPADPGSHGEALFNRLCAILESGKNVVSTALVQMHYPPRCQPS
jgi:4-hydroxy-tetrahydrodipicolinate reductase